VESSSTKWIRAPRGGIFRLEVELGTKLEKGQQVGVISDPTDAEYYAVTTPIAGIVLRHGGKPLVCAGAGIVHVAALHGIPEKGPKTSRLDHAERISEHEQEDHHGSQRDPKEKLPRRHASSVDRTHGGGFERTTAAADG